MASLMYLNLYSESRSYLRVCFIPQNCDVSVNPSDELVIVVLAPVGSVFNDVYAPVESVRSL